jgi:S1-C subfamily serine protease
MSRPGIAHKTLLVPVLALVLLLPGAGPATANHRSPAQPPRPAALPSVSQLLKDTGLADLLAQLLQAPTQARGGVPSGVASRVAASTVKVSSVACGERVEGSGFSAAPDTIVTNAHVVAGATRTEVLRPDGRRLPAQVLVFDPDRDLALLSVPGLGQQPLPLASAAVGGNGAVVGHPQGQVPVEVSPAVVVRRVMATTTDIYGEGAIRRPILVLAARLAPGDSGAPLINPSGEVTGVAFAVSAFRPSTAFAIPSETLAPVLDRPRTGVVSTGPCLG